MNHLLHSTHLMLRLMDMCACVECEEWRFNKQSSEEEASKPDDFYANEVEAVYQTAVKPDVPIIVNNSVHPYDLSYD